MRAHLARTILGLSFICVGPAVAGKGMPKLFGHKPVFGIDVSQAEGYWEKWHLVTIRYRKDNDQLRAIYANDIAWEAIRQQAPRFPVGAMFAKTVFDAGPDPVFPASLIPAGVHSVQIMKKDDAAFKDTNGWGFALVEDETFSAAQEKKLVASCFACHQIVKDHDFIFSSYAYSPSSYNPGSLFEDKFHDAEVAKLSQFGQTSAKALGPPPARLKVFESPFFTGQRTAVGSIAQFADRNKSAYLVLDEKSKKFLLALPMTAAAKADCKNGVRFKMSPEGFAEGSEAGRVCDGKVVYEERKISPTD